MYRKIKASKDWILIIPIGGKHSYVFCVHRYNVDLPLKHNSCQVEVIAYLRQLYTFKQRRAFFKIYIFTLFFLSLTVSDSSQAKKLLPIPKCTPFDLSAITWSQGLKQLWLNFNVETLWLSSALKLKLLTVLS